MLNGAPSKACYKRLSHVMYTNNSNNVKLAVKQQSTTNLRANQITIYKIHGFTTGIRFILHMMMDTASHPSEWICMCCCNKNVAHVFNNPVQYIVVIGQTTKQSVAFCLQQLKSNLLFYSECG